jgi:siroheme synthase-like protein
MNRALVPVLLDLTGLTVLFVGAGEGTRVKLTGLLSSAANALTVRVVAPRISAEVAALAEGLVGSQILVRPFVETDLDGVSLVYGMTDDAGVNASVAALCLSRGLWCNVAQNRGPGSFSSPALGRRDGIVAAFSSETASPAVSVAARDAWMGGET